MIFPSISDFHFVSGDLEDIRLDVDVLPNRTGTDQGVLYGKDVAVLMEGSCIRHQLLSGLTLRNFVTLSSTSDSGFFARTIPAPFTRAFDSGLAHRFLPKNHSTEIFSSSLGNFTMRYTGGWPQSVPFFTSDPICVESSGYSTSEPYHEAPLLASNMRAWLNDVKKQQFSFVDVGYSWYDHYNTTTYGDTPSLYNAHGSFVMENPTIFSYFAERWTSRPISGDGWFIASNASKPFTISYPTDYIASAWLFMECTGFNVHYSYFNFDTGETTDLSFAVPRFVSRLSTTPSSGTFTINQQTIISTIRDAVSHCGPFKTMDDVLPVANGHGSYWFNGPDILLTLVFQMKPSIAWWLA